MISLIATPILFIASPFILIGLALKSWVWMVAGVVVGALYLSVLFFNAFSEFKNELRAHLVEPETADRLLQLWREAGPERVEVRFWSYAYPQAEFKVWVGNAKSLDFFLSQGLLNRCTDLGMKSIFKDLAQKDVSDMKLQNRQHALRCRLDRLKGPSESFRYWLFSFWFYPLEWLLKIAKM